MKAKIIKSRRVSNGILELIEFVDNFGNIIKYEITLGSMQGDITGSGAGNFKKIIEFERWGEAINFFNNQV